MKFSSSFSALLCLLLIENTVGNHLQSKQVSLEVRNSNTGQGISSTMHGAILETNINRGDDGGLYAELIYNRAFQGRNCHLYLEILRIRSPIL